MPRGAASTATRHLSPNASREQQDVLEDEGWKVTASGASPKPFANLDKDGLHLSLRPDVLRGSDQMTYGISGECIRVTDDQVAQFGDRDKIDVGS